MSDRARWIAFGLVACFQLALPGWMIMQHERILTEGMVLLFRTAPIDPSDPFRGEYVILNFEAESGPWTVPGATTGGSMERYAFAVLASDGAGFARITRLASERPIDSAFVRVKFMNYGTDTVFRVALPFDRYYLEEGDGATAGKMLMPQWMNDTLVQPMPAHAVVRVLRGEAVIEDLVVGGRPIQEWLEQRTTANP